MSTTATYVEFFEKLQSEFLSSLKQAQEQNLKTLASFSDLAAAVPSFKVENLSAELPTPTAIVESAFNFTNEIIETRKEYMTKLAELATDAQKQFAETTKRFAEISKN
jgi:hypothetical protein